MRSNPEHHSYFVQPLCTELHVHVAAKACAKNDSPTVERRKARKLERSHDHLLLRYAG